MDALEILKPWIKDGFLTAVIVYLLIVDRLDRKADREFWTNFYERNKAK